LNEVKQSEKQSESEGKEKSEKESGGRREKEERRKLRCTLCFSALLFVRCTGFEPVTPTLSR
jgi:hypothetical protein